jgi:colanic acid/amylovoran biosynthesis glycosyltransferase
MMKKKVVHFIPNAWLSRTNTWLYNEVTLLGEDWESWVMANRTVNLNEFPYDKVFSLKEKHGKVRWFFEMVLKKAGIFKQCPTLQHVTKELCPDIIHSHFGNVGWANIGLAKSIGAKHLVSFYGYDVSYIPRKKRWKKRYSALFNSVDAVLCEGTYMGKTLEKLGCPSSKIKIYRLGIDLCKIPYSKPEWNINKPLRILMAASFVEKKGLPYALEAIGNFIREQQDIKVQMTIIGSAYKSRSSQQELRKMNNVIDELDMRKYITFKGSCDHNTLIRLAREHDIFLSPSVTSSTGDSEGGAPVTIIEMAAAGLPIISTIHCDIPSVLGESNRKLLVAERDSSSITRVMNWLIEHSSEWNTLTFDNRKHIESNLNIRNQGPALADIYNSVLAMR